jgi:hypothetical protein
MLNPWTVCEERSNKIKKTKSYQHSREITKNINGGDHLTIGYVDTVENEFSNKY